MIYVFNYLIMFLLKKKKRKVVIFVIMIRPLWFLKLISNIKTLNNKKINDRLWCQLFVTNNFKFCIQIENKFLHPAKGSNPTTRQQKFLEGIYKKKKFFSKKKKKMLKGRVIASKGSSKDLIGSSSTCFHSITLLRVFLHLG
jgi:hypothetical protein